ncbi:MAG: ParA family protein [Bacteroidota bacterium]
MLKVVTITSLKGGTSKSTLCLNLFYYLQQEGRNIGIIDADRQGSLLELTEGREEFPLITRDDFKKWSDIKKFNEVDLLVVDSAPRMETNETRDMLNNTDLALIPCKASQFDVNALQHTLDIIEEIQEDKKDLRAAIVITQGYHSSSIVDDLRKSINEYGHPVLATEMKYRVDYSHSLPYEKGILSSANQKAKEEIKGIAIEIQNLLRYVG